MKEETEAGNTGRNVAEEWTQGSEAPGPMPLYPPIPKKYSLDRKGVGGESSLETEQPSIYLSHMQCFR